MFDEADVVARLDAGDGEQIHQLPGPVNRPFPAAPGPPHLHRPVPLTLLMSVNLTQRERERESVCVCVCVYRFIYPGEDLNLNTHRLMGTRWGPKLRKVNCKVKESTVNARTPLRYYRNCCLNDVQFDNIMYFAKTKQNAYRVHACIILRGDEGVKQCTSALRACSFTAWFSRCIKSDRKIQDMGQNIYIFMFHIVKIAQRVPFFLQNKHDYKCDIDLYNSSINNELILRDLRFRHHIAFFAPFRQYKININCHSTVFVSLSNMTVIRS